MSGAVGAQDVRGRDASGPEAAERRRWLILVVGLIAMTAGCTYQYGLAYLIPALRHEGFSLEVASTLVACPAAGLLLTLIGWGAAADRWGERVVLASGLSVAGVVLLAARNVHGTAGLAVCLILAGASGGSVFAASGRLILGWFARHERGLAMGIRQSSQPIGVALAAASLPALGASGPAAPLLFLGLFCLVAAALVIVLVRDPARPQPPARPAGLERRRRTARPCSGASTRPARCWSCRSSPSPRSRWYTSWTRAAGPRSRPAGCWPARRPAVRCPGSGPATGPTGPGSRMRPMRLLAISTGAGMLALAAGAAAGSAVAVPVLLACAVVAVSTNGLAFTAVAEYAGSAWAGRALGVQNTGQNALAASTPPVLALTIGAAGYGVSFAAVAAFPLLAAALVPVRAERSWAPSGHALVGGQGEEVDVVVREGDVGEQ